MTGTTRSSSGLDERCKRLLFRCWHRGTHELTQLETLLEVNDPDLYAAITSDKVLPAEVTGALFARIKAYPIADGSV